MIDVTEELKKYTYIDTNKVMLKDYDELSLILQSVAKAYDRIGKDQFKSSTILEELTEIIEANIEKDDQLRAMKAIVNKSESNSNKLLEGLLDINDAFEDIYSYGFDFSKEGFKEGMVLQRNKNLQRLSLCGITVIGSKGDIFDFNIHVAKEVRLIEGLTEGAIIEVIRYGYIYDSQVIRKAEVVVNKKMELIQGGI